jgi:hypothetical protein
MYSYLKKMVVSGVKQPCFAYHKLDRVRVKKKMVSKVHMVSSPSGGVYLIRVSLRWFQEGMHHHYHPVPSTMILEHMSTLLSGVRTIP